MKWSMMQSRKYTAMFAATMVEPTGVPPTMATSMPASAHVTESAAEQRVTPLKLLNRRMADRAGKMISAEINS